MNNQNNVAVVSDKGALSDVDLDKVSGGDVVREVVRTPPRTKPTTYTQGGVTHEDSWNTQT